MPPRTIMKALILTPLSLLALAAISSAQGPTSYRYSHDLSTLALPTPGLDSAGRTLYLDLQLSDGSQLGNGTTSVTLSNFVLTGGTFGDALPDIGGVTRSGGQIVLRDTASSIGGLADAAIAFTIPTGSVLPRLEFDFEIATTGFDTPVPDYFSVSFLLSDLSPLTTDGTVGSESLGVRIASNPPPAPESFTATAAYAADRSANGDPRFVGFSRPTATITAVPEPTTMAALGLGALALLRRKRRK